MSEEKEQRHHERAPVSEPTLEGGEPRAASDSPPPAASEPSPRAASDPPPEGARDVRAPGPARAGEGQRAPLFFQYLAAAVSAFALFNEVRVLSSPGLSAAYILFYVPFARAGADICLLLLALFLLASAFGPVRAKAAVAGLSAGLLGLAAIALLNAAEFYWLVYKGHITTSWPVPLSLVLSIYLVLHTVFCLWVRYKDKKTRQGEAIPEERPARSLELRRGKPVAAGLAAFASLALVLLFHLHALGLTDYRRPADAILVFGARVYASGRPSEALSERVETAAALYRQGLARRLIVSGGVGSEGHSEPKVMRAIARRAGVPDEAIIEDEEGVNTEASVRNTEALARRYGLRSVLAVSHYHHLPRIKLLCTRVGLQCFTVPADEGEAMLRMTPYYVLREMAALTWAYVKG